MPSTRTLPVNGAATPYHDNVFWSGIVNAPLLPSTALPVPRPSADSLPVGVQCIGAEFADYTTIGFAEQLAKALHGDVPFYERPKGFGME